MSAKSNDQKSRNLIVLGLLVALAFVLAFALMGKFIVEEVKLESSCQKLYGVTWKAEFEKYHGTLTRAHAKIAVAMWGMAAMSFVMFWTCRQVIRSGKHKRIKQYNLTSWVAPKPEVPDKNLAAPSPSENERSD